MALGLTLAGWTFCLLAGMVLQRRTRRPGRLSHVLFLVTFWATSPLVVFFAYTTVEVDVSLLQAMALAVGGSWLVLAIGLGWGRWAGRDDAERGSMALGAALGNTGIVGYPLAVLVFGAPGLALAVIYSEFQFLIPVLAVSTGVARRFAGPASFGAAATPGLRATARNMLLNPPVAAGLLAVSLRLAGADLRDEAAPVGPAAGLLIGMFGFVQLGLAAPLHRIAHDAAHLLRGAGTLALRCAAAPLLLHGLGRLCGVEVPGAFLLLAATPVAFHTMVLARVYDLDLALQRLLIVFSTPLVIAAVLLWHAG
jgi:predicted permease